MIWIKVNKVVNDESKVRRVLSALDYLIQDEGVLMMKAMRRF